MSVKGFFLAYLLLVPAAPLYAAQDAPTAASSATTARTYALPPAQAYEAVMGALGQLGMPIESSNPTGGHVKSSTAYRSGLFMTLEVTNVYVQAAGDGSTVRVERFKGKTGKTKPDNDPAALAAFFSALDHQVSSRTAN